LTIHLHNVEFFAYHGVHDEEKILGNEYEVNADISFEPAGPVTQLDQTIDYVAVYQLIKNRMTIPSLLLETVAEDIIAAIHAKFQQTSSISILIRKKYPPVTAFIGSVSVSCTKEF
jgi:dihydroneopterin aldolase